MCTDGMKGEEGKASLLYTTSVYTVFGFWSIPGMSKLECEPFRAALYCKPIARLAGPTTHFFITICAGD